MFNVGRIRQIKCHPVTIDDDSAPDSITDTEDCLNWNGDLDHPNDSEDDSTAVFEFNIEQDNIIEDLWCPELWDVSAAPNVSGLIRPTQKLQRQAEQVLMTVNAIETRRNKGAKKM